MAADEFPRRHPDTAFRAVGEDGGLVVLPTQREVKVLNPVGIKIYSLLDGRHSTPQIAEAVAAEFDVALERAEQDVRAFLDELKRDGMLDDSGGAARQTEETH